MSTIVTVTPNPALDQTVRVAHLALGGVNQAASLEFNAGGKGVNVAGCLADYGIATIATGLLGSEGSSAFDALFAGKRITDRFVRIAGQPRINVKLVDAARGETTDINLASAAVSPDAVAALEAQLAALAEPGRWFVLAGSLPPGIGADFYRRMTRRLHAAGARVALDTSGAPLAQVLAATDPAELPDLMKPNRDELEAVLGRPLADRQALCEAACALVARGVRHVAVSLGEHGALGVSAAGGERSGTAGAVYDGFRAAPLRVPVASTVGAGDAFVAGLVASLVEGRGWAEAGRRATAFAAAKLARVGPHLPDRATLEALASQVEIESFTIMSADGADGQPATRAGAETSWKN
ncbi:MAG: Tagatose-6-phosphate kinase [Burkholderia plantarii]|nr:MAG: Tagatose-6-phosphate kinase [Burkholderia plantarii]